MLCMWYGSYCIVGFPGKYYYKNFDSKNPFTFKNLSRQNLSFSMHWKYYLDDSGYHIKALLSNLGVTTPTSLFGVLLW